ncbi:hypothetical protein [Breznakiella homolactica]|uniref:Uncharacterized protein n=1 Tax=Breznakiella homolactica TaxID=2798577 RepID=A0A7T8BAA4_9SPIR|nr:hypothetical protein [Breznakiella homolactica]QQO09171.1 hypothetical protein JFL75_19935 [Breznakiella homolactica]
MANHFPKGEVCFDAESKWAVSFSNKMAAKTGNKGALMHFYVNNPRQSKAWSRDIAEVTCEPYCTGIPRKKSWESQTRIRMAMLDGLGMMKLVRIRFAG